MRAARQKPHRDPSVPLCIAGGPAREITASGSLILVAAAFGIHMGAMLLTTGVMAASLCRGVAVSPGLLDIAAECRAGTLAIVGACLIALA